MRMAIPARWLAVCSPSGMSDSSMGVKGFGQVGLLFVDKLFQLGDFADLLESKHLILFVTVNGKTCRILIPISELIIVNI